ncbi:MAG: hypothetical protein ACXAEU_22630 [Candidatus Hodarchaeales archaeon]
MTVDIHKSSVIRGIDSDLESGHTLFYSKMTALTLFKQTRLGPSPFGDLELPYNTSNDNFDLYKLGSFYTMAIGQGMHYNTGLFGPLPVLGTNYRCLVHAATVNDPHQQDKRMKGKNYLITCFFYHKELETAVQHNRNRLTEAIDGFYKRYGNLEELEKNWNLLKITVQNYVYCTDTCIKNGVIEP